MPALLLLLLATALQAGTQPPVRESIDLSAVTLNRLVLEPATSPLPGLLPAKSQQLPLSVQLYLKPSGQLDHLSRAVQKAAVSIRKAVAPGAKQKDLLRDSPRVASAVREWLDLHLPLDPTVDYGSQPSTDQRTAWPKASALLAGGKSDADGRALAAVALLRALKVPARVAWARGGLTVQYWCALAPPIKAASQPVSRKAKAGRGKRSQAAKKGPKEPQGYWALLDPTLLDAEVDAWSLDAGVLGRSLWKPAQELSATRLAWQRAVFDQGDSLAAQAAYSASLDLGRLTFTAAVAPQALSPAVQGVLQGLTRGSRTLWVLTVQAWHLQVDGNMGGMDPVQLLTPYRPQLASWSREQRGAVRELELEAQGLWSDRPQRFRLRKGSLGHEWSSPPPALGVLHWVSFGLPRHPQVLQAYRQSDKVDGVLLRADNLSPVLGATVMLAPAGNSSAARSAKVGEDGHFNFTLTPAEAEAQVLDLRAGEAGEGDVQRLPKAPLN